MFIRRILGQKVALFVSQELVTTEEAKKTTVDDLFDKFSSSKKGLSSSDVEKKASAFWSQRNS